MPNDNHIQAQNDIQLPDTGPSWTKSGLQFALNPSKSARAWNITSLFWILFEGYLARAFCCCFKTCMEEEGAHARLRLCLEFYLNVTLRVHFSFAFKRISVMHSFFFWTLHYACIFKVLPNEYSGYRVSSKFLGHFRVTWRRGKILFF